ATSFGLAHAARSPHLVIAGKYSIEIAYKNTKLPYNILLGNGPICYVGSLKDVEGIVKKMVKNHSFGNGLELAFRLDRYDGDITARIGNDDVSISKCETGDN